MIGYRAVPKSKRKLFIAGVIAFKIALTVAALVLSAKPGNELAKAWSGSSYSSGSMVSVFLASLILPIWYYSPIIWRLGGAVAAILAGTGVWATSLLVPVFGIDAGLSSLLIGGTRAAAMFVSLVVGILILRFGRRRTAH
jgi:hypothetical protein